MEEHRFTAGAAPPRIVARLEEGSIAVGRNQENVIVVVIERRARAADRASARALLDGAPFRVEEDEEDGTIRIEGRALIGTHGVFGTSLRTNVELLVPKETELDLRTEDGSIELQGISASIAAESGDGRVRMRDIEGRARVRAVDGAIIGSELRGDFDVVSEDGRIELSGDFRALRAVTADGSVRITCGAILDPRSDWTIRTSDGPVELRLPETLSANIEASASDGRIVLELSRFEGRTDENRVRGRIGAGGPLILVTTMDGHIRLEEN